MSNVLTTIFLRGVAIICGNLYTLQPWAAREKVFDRYPLVLGQCLSGVSWFSPVERTLDNTFVG